MSDPVIEHPNGVHSKRYTEKSMEKVEKLEEKAKAALAEVLPHIFSALASFSNGRWIRIL